MVVAFRFVKVNRVRGNSVCVAHSAWLRSLPVLCARRLVSLESSRRMGSDHKDWWSPRSRVDHSDRKDLCSRQALLHVLPQGLILTARVFASLFTFFVGSFCSVGRTAL